MLWAVGRYDLRLTEEEFWHMVPKQFYALIQRRNKEILAAEFGPAMITSALVSAFAGKKAKQVKPSDFMPSYKAPKQKEMPWEEQLKLVKELHHAFGGA